MRHGDRHADSGCRQKNAGEQKAKGQTGDIQHAALAPDRITIANMKNTPLIATAIWISPGIDPSLQLIILRFIQYFPDIGCRSAAQAKPLKAETNKTSYRKTGTSL
ncbi:hypothetical protein [Quatrionicoccus australiensis]|uniref:hypothetical protein n=1 Tax=Quatrionicoccus australiensis TaxID=138118 RepID=UPI001CF97CE5|nr:hypothetical protein [Quatrionicoccus australiensis]MCB4361956.1 hypothetical protein [Quatrionicoccus australiensis]